MNKVIIVYCTICSKNKCVELKKIPAIERYQSERIRKIYERSISDRAGFRIFSGKFGLLKPGKKIFWYNEKLIQENTNKMVRLLSQQIRKGKIDELVFFARNIKNNHSWRPYIFSLKKASNQAGIKFKIRYL